MFAVITPVHVHRSEYLLEAYQSLCRQTHDFWHWHILLNGEAARLPATALHSTITEDPRVTVHVAWGLGAEPTIGSLKQVLCKLSTEPFILELDYDDILDPNALGYVDAAFRDGADFVYSNFAEFRSKPDPHSGQLERVANEPYGKQYGWRSYSYTDGYGSKLIAMAAPPVTPQNLRLVDWAPNHLRAWTRAFYESVGGHDPRLPFADDHDLVVRMYLAGAKMTHIDRCLYLYRVHDSNTVAIQNKSIRENTWAVYNRHVTQLAEKFANDTGTLKVDLCGGQKPFRAFVSLDLDVGESEGGIRCDLNERWPLAANTVGVLRAADALEHLRDPIRTMNEAYRVLRPGGFFLTATPSTNGKGAFCDPTHVSFWNDLSFRYYSEKEYAALIPAFKGRFQLIKNVEYFPTEWHRQNNVPYVEAHLIKLGEGYEPMGVAWRD